MRSYISLFAISALVTTFGIQRASAQISPTAAPATEPSPNWLDAPHLSPFQAVRWTAPQVEVAGTWYELIAVNDVSADEILNACQSADPANWTLRFEDDWVAVLRSMGEDPGKTVTLKVKDIQTGDEQTLEHVAMTSANRTALHNARPLIQATASPQDSLRISPFDAVRWRRDVPEVQIDGLWYEFLAMNEFSVDQVIADCKAWDADLWRRRFEEDMIEAMDRAGHKVAGPTVNLKAEELSTGIEQSLPNVPITPEKRLAIVRAARSRAASATQPTTQASEPL